MTEADFRDIEFARKTVNDMKLECDDDKLLELCARNCRQLLPRMDEATTCIMTRLNAALTSRTPWSLVRVGDGEGNILSLCHDNWGEFATRYFNLGLGLVHGTNLSSEQANSFANRLRAAIIHADCVGVRSVDRGFLKEPSGILKELDLVEIYGLNHDSDMRGTFGVLSARRFFYDGIVSGIYRDCIITSAWIHLGILPFLNDICERSSEIIVINGRRELEAEFHRRFGRKLRQFIVTPIEGDASHYHEAFPRICDELSGKLDGVLVLVGSGIIGKLYCDLVKKNGGVALDLGSAFDILAGQQTRPVHTNVDCQKLRWL